MVPDAPRGWVVRPLGEVVDVRLSSVDKKSAPDEVPVRLCNYMDVYSNPEIREGLAFMRATATPDEIARFRLEPGDVIITKDSEQPSDIAVPTVVAEHFAEPLVCGYHLALLRPAGIDGRYLAWALRSRPVNDQFARRANGTTRFGLTSAVIHDARIPLPPLPEQRKIAAILSSVDDAIAATRKVIEQAERVKRGLLQTLMTRGIGHTRFKQTEIGEIPEEWEVVSLGDVTAHITKGATPTTFGHDWSDQDDGGVLFLRSECVSEDGFSRVGSAWISPVAHERMARSVVRAGDVLVTITGNVGRVGQVPSDVQEANINQHIARVRVTSESLGADFVHFALQTEQQRARFERIVTGLAYPQLSLKQIRETVVPLPSRREQDQIVLRINQTVRALQSQNESLAHLQLLKRGLLQDLLTGRVRVTPD